jgi:hypothetical protein
MDEREFREQMLLLAEPIAATSNAVDAVVGRVSAKRRNRVVVGTITTGLVVIAAASAIATSGQRSTGPVGSPDDLKISTYVDKWGITLQMTTVFPDERELTAGHVEVGNATGKATTYANDGTDPDAGPPVPLSLKAGVSVLVEATVQPDCAAGMPERVAFTINSQLSGGRSVVNQYAPDSTVFYESAYRLWCHVGVGIQVGGGGLSGGDAGVAVRVVNSTSEDITFEMPALDAEGAQWDSLSATVPAGGEKALTAIGHGVKLGVGQDVPWQMGRILVNGEPYDVPVSDVW